MQVVDERVVGAAAAHNRRDQHLLVEHFQAALLHQLDKWMIGIGARRFFSGQHLDLHVREALRVQVMA